jgi:hypothetical protein
MADQLPTEIAPRVSRLLTAAEFHQLADVPPEVEWFANLSNPSTRRAYENAVRDFMRFTGIRPAGRISHRDPCAYHRVARRPGAARAWRPDHSAPAGVIVIAVRISVREERCHTQSS